MNKISIIIPLASPNDYIFKNIRIINLLSIKDKLEIIVLPDHNFEIDLEIDIDLTIIPTGKIGPAEKRDIGVAKAKYEIIAFLDDDSYPSKSWPGNALQLLEEPENCAVGGPGITPDDEEYWSKVSGGFYISPVGGGSRDRYVPINKVKKVDDWPTVNLIIKKDDFLAVGGFNSEFWPGEDTKLCYELIHSLGKKIIYDPSCIVLHYRRGSLIKHLLQVAGYGIHRGFFAKKFPETSFRLKYFIPSIFLIVLVISFSYSLIKLNSIFIILFISLYLLTIFIINLFFLRQGWNIFYSIPVLFYTFLSHTVYGFSFIKGLIFTKNLKSRLR